MSDLLVSVIEQIHSSGRKMVLAITGGGTGAIAGLLQVPGGSRSLLEAIVPYDLRALTRFLGTEPKHACSADTAIDMALRARDRAARFLHSQTHLVGIGATASLLSDRPKQGEHRCHIATATDIGSTLISMVLEKGMRNRPQEEALVANAIVYCVAEACGVRPPDIASLLGTGDQLTKVLVPSADSIDRLLRGDVNRMTVLPDGQFLSPGLIPRGVLAGSFDPLHEGHIELASVAEEFLGSPVSFEISVVNVDKPPLDANTVRQRVAQFAWRANVELTRSPTFGEKSRLLPGTTFVVGADTAERIVSPTYYADSESHMLDALQTIRESGCRFLVAARADSAGQVHSLDHMAIPRRFQNLFTQIPESRFRHDVSSRSIRAHTEKQ